MQPPAGGWSITYEKDGQSWLFSGRPILIVNQIAAVQKANDWYMGDDAIWEFCNEEWCKRDPQRCMKKRVDSRNPAETFAGAVLSWIKGGMKPVSQTVANERARICTHECSGKDQYNKKSQIKCSSCLAKVASLTKLAIRGRTTPYDSKLKHCIICKCDLKLKVHFPPNEGDKNNYPDYCWVSKERNE